MAGENVSLKEHFETRFEALEKLFDQKGAGQDRAVTIAMSAAEKAVTKAEEAMSARLALLNESRQTIADQTAVLLPRTEYAMGHKELIGRVELVEKTQGRSSGVAIGISGIAILITVAEFIRSFVVK